jgi:hypothetical protein
MQVTVRGWSRDMGARVLLTAELASEPAMEQELKTIHKGETYFKLERDVRESPRGRRKVDYRVRVLAHAELNLNGSYLVQLELSRRDIDRLFYLTNGDRGLPKLLETFSTFKTLEDHGLPQEQVEAPAVSAAPVETPAIPNLAFNPAFLKKVDELELSVRTASLLKHDNIVYIGDLVQRTEAEMLRTPNFGRKSLNEVKEVLVMMGLHLGTEVPGWPPENIEELAKRFEDHY